MTPFNMDHRFREHATVGVGARVMMRQTKTLFRENEQAADKLAERLFYLNDEEGSDCVVRMVKIRGGVNDGRFMVHVARHDGVEVKLPMRK